MTNMNFGYNALDDVDAHTGGGRVVPDSGDYNVMISSIGMESSAKGGHNIVVKYSILDGDFAGTEITEWLPVVCASETAQNIALSKLKAMYVVTNKTKAKMFQELEGALLRIRILKKEAQFTNSNGELVDTFNSDVNMYISTKGLDPNGKEVPDYSGPAIIPMKKKATGGGGNNRRPAASSDPFADDGDNYGGNSRSNSSNNDYDDEIPF